jgi:hypothetical protein
LKKCPLFVVLNSRLILDYKVVVGIFMLIVESFNKALIFDTTQSSRHGICLIIKAPSGYFRKSLAVYYLCEPSIDAPSHARELYAPTEEQKSEETILEMIRKRVDVTNSAEVYRTK